MSVSGAGQAGKVAVADVLRITPLPDALPGPDRLQVTSSTNGTLLRFAGNPGGMYQLQRSSDLNAWTNINVLPNSPNGVLEYLDPGAPFSHAFYRIRTP
jgi:hypothetical protein